MRITTKGQVTIPADVREQAGLLPHTEVEFRIEDGVVQLVPVGARKKPGRGALLVAHLRGRAKGGMSTDEIMAMTRAD